MLFSTLAFTALLGLTSAQGQRVIPVLVGANSSQTYSPSNIKANIGDMIQFQFIGGNHTVTQSTLDQACQPVSLFSNITGFHSGFIPAAASAAMGMTATYSILINSTTPIWIYCAQAKHCENGMSMVINENTSQNSIKSLVQYRINAKNANTVIPNSNGNGGTSGSQNGQPGSGTNNGAGSLAVPSTLSLLVFAAGAYFL